MSTRRFALSAVVVCLVVFVVAILLPQPAQPAQPVSTPRPTFVATPYQRLPTATPTVQGRILAAIGPNDRAGAPQPDILITDPAVLVTFASDDGLTANSILRSSQAQSVAIARVVRAFTPRTDLFITVTGPLTDVYGNTSEKDILRLRITRATLERINFDTFRVANLPDAADFYWQHPALPK